MLKRHACKYFIFAAAAIAITVFLSDDIFSFISRAANLSDNGMDIAGEGFRIIVLLVIVFAAKMQSRIFKSGRKSFTYGLFVGLPVLAVAAVQFIANTIQADQGFFSNTGMITAMVISYCLTGIFEELLCRGLVLNAFLDAFKEKSAKTIWLSLILSSIIFGSLHLYNLVSGQDIIGTLMQVLMAVAMGLCFGAIYLRCGNIWVPALLHALTDLTGAIGTNASSTTAAQNSTLDQMTSILSILPSLLILIGLTLFYLRKSKMREVEKMVKRNAE
ncbi:MAG: lysostaphin resistance A-like protein [Eubacterium sp.]